MTYSYTQLAQYLACPLRYRYRYLDGWQEKETRAGLLFGRAFEQALAALFRREDPGCALFEAWSRTNLELHHCQFRSRRGEDTEEKMITLCHECHRAIHGRSLTEIDSACFYNPLRDLRRARDCSPAHMGRIFGGPMRSPILRLVVASLLLVAWGVVSPAKNSDSSSGSSQNPNDSSGQQQQPPLQQPDQSKDRKKKKDKKDKGFAEVFSTAVVNSVLNDLRDGLEGHTQRLMLSAFDADKMDGYLGFEDQIEAFFNKYTSFSVYFRIAQSATDGPKGIVLVDIQLEEIPRDATSPPIRKYGQIRFELERGKKGWKIVDFNPRNFFS